MPFLPAPVTIGASQVWTQVIDDAAAQDDVVSIHVPLGLKTIHNRHGLPAANRARLESLTALHQTLRAPHR